MPIPSHLEETLRAVLARLVPADNDPGAVELGGEAFINERIAAEPELLAVYERGLSLLAEHGFSSLAGDDQDGLLKVLEAKMPEFFSVVCNHAIEAVYVHSEGLRMVGFEVTQ